MSSKAAGALFLAATAAFVITSGGSAEQGPDEVSVQGGWAYTARSKDGAVDHVATTRAAEDAVWFMLACGADGRLTVSLVHSEHFPFPLKPVFLVKLHSSNVPTATCRINSGARQRSDYFRRFSLQSVRSVRCLIAASLETQASAGMESFHYG